MLCKTQTYKDEGMHLCITIHYEIDLRDIEDNYKKGEDANLTLKYIKTSSKHILSRI